MINRKYNVEAGQVYGEWCVIDPSVKHIGYLRHALCRCSCGTEKPIRPEKLVNGSSMSCGCKRNENLITHGMTSKYKRKSSRVYWIWNSMLQRCTNNNNKGYINYGGRGITVCDRWLKFENFHKDMGDKPKNMTLERKDNEKGYSHENCYWANRGVQNRNKRNNHNITVDGETKCITEWGRSIGLSHTTIIARINNGWPESLAVTLPKGSRCPGQ